MIERREVNPWPFGETYGFCQAMTVNGGSTVMYCAGQAAVDATGTPQHPGDMARQLELSLDNLEVVLTAGGMGLSSLVRLNVYTTDVKVLLEHYEVVLARLRAADVRPPGTLLEVSALGVPGILVEIEGTAVA